MKCLSGKTLKILRHVRENLTKVGVRTLRGVLREVRQERTPHAPVSLFQGEGG